MLFGERDERREMLISSSLLQMSIWDFPAMAGGGQQEAPGLMIDTEILRSDDLG
jgi:hypothetical protein